MHNKEICMFMSVQEKESMFVSVQEKSAREIRIRIASRRLVLRAPSPQVRRAWVNALMCFDGPVRVHVGAR